jgi:hypothetical protein
LIKKNSFPELELAKKLAIYNNIFAEKLEKNGEQK